MRPHITPLNNERGKIIELKKKRSWKLTIESVELKRFHFGIQPLGKNKFLNETVT